MTKRGTPIGRLDGLPRAVLMSFETPIEEPGKLVVYLDFKSSPFIFNDHDDIQKHFQPQTDVRATATPWRRLTIPPRVEAAV